MKESDNCPVCQRRISDIDMTGCEHPETGQRWCIEHLHTFTHGVRVSVTDFLLNRLSESRSDNIYSFMLEEYSPDGGVDREYFTSDRFDNPWSALQAGVRFVEANVAARV
jgi:hypothetical protein